MYIVTLGYFALKAFACARIELISFGAFSSFVPKIDLKKPGLSLECHSFKFVKTIAVFCPLKPFSVKTERTPGIFNKSSVILAVNSSVLLKECRRSYD